MAAVAKIPVAINFFLVGIWRLQIYYYTLAILSLVKLLVLGVLAIGKGKHRTRTSVMRSETKNALVIRNADPQYLEVSWALLQLAKKCVPQQKMKPKRKATVHITTIVMVALVIQSNEKPSAITKMRR